MAEEARPLWAHVFKAPEHDLLDEMTEFQPAVLLLKWTVLLLLN
jgi:hypothetical protein